MFWKWSKRISLSVLTLFTLLLLGGASYQFIYTKIDKKRHPPKGQLVDIGGYKLHLHSTGSGGPVVILDSGLGCVSSDWSLVQSEISKFSQVISYDRAGTGWSETSPYARTSSQIVKELHLLLTKTNIPKPYILVGHSFGGNNIQLYAATYPEEVLGIVLVDSCHELQEQKLPIPPQVKNKIKLMQSSQTMRLLSTFGISRFLLKKRLKVLMPYTTKPIQNVHLALCSTIKHAKALSAEARLLSESLKQLEKADLSHIKNKPCFILSAGKETNPAKFGASKEEMLQLQIVWNELQKDLASKFTNHHHLIAEKSDHMILWHQPELIVYAVKELIEKNDVLLGIHQDPKATIEPPLLLNNRLALHYKQE